MPEYLSPGVFVEEFESGSRPMEGVSTSTAGFLGFAERGPVGGRPQLVTSFADYQRLYGGYLSEKEYGDFRFLPLAVEHFFYNGGARAYIVRAAVAPVAAKADDVAQFPAIEGNATPLRLTFSAKSPGSGGNKLCVTFAEASGGDATKCKITVTFDSTVEAYDDLPMALSAQKDVLSTLSKSSLIVADAATADAKTPITAEALKAEVKLTFSAGSDGQLTAASVKDALMGKDMGPGQRTGLPCFLDESTVSLLAVPGITNADVQGAVISFCAAQKSCFAVLDIPKDTANTNDLKDFRNRYDSQYAALYHPWLQVYSPLEKKSVYMPPSGAVLGIYARTDNTRGVHKAPANEVVRNCTGLAQIFNKGEQDILNPMGVNLIRVFPGQGIRVWGARTISSNTLWKYVNVRRLFIFLEESIRKNTNWVVFEPNDEMLWMRVRRTIEVFLTDVWRSGALVGAAANEAFYVACGRTTMSQGDIDNGLLICEIGVAPVKPAEFVIFRLTQKTAEE